jgi:hypothetical protein
MRWLLVCLCLLSGFWVGSSSRGGYGSCPTGEAPCLSAAGPCLVHGSQSSESFHRRRRRRIPVGWAHERGCGSSGNAMNLRGGSSGVGQEATGDHGAEGDYDNVGIPTSLSASSSKGTGGGFWLPQVKTEPESSANGEEGQESSLDVHPEGSLREFSDGDYQGGQGRKGGRKGVGGALGGGGMWLPLDAAAEDGEDEAAILGNTGGVLGGGGMWLPGDAVGAPEEEGVAGRGSDGGREEEAGEEEEAGTSSPEISPPKQEDNMWLPGGAHPAGGAASSAKPGEGTRGKSKGGKPFWIPCCKSSRGGDPSSKAWG